MWSLGGQERKKGGGERNEVTPTDKRGRVVERGNPPTATLDATSYYIKISQ